MLALSRSDGSDGVSHRIRPQRLLKLVFLLESGSVLAVDELANSFGVSRRTIFRDIKVLRSANVPIAFDLAHGGYCIQRNGAHNIAADAPLPATSWVHDGEVCRCPKILSDEIAALLLAIRVAGPLPEKIAAACETALVKIMAAALPAAREQAIHILEQHSEPGEDSDSELVLRLRPSG